MPTLVPFSPGLYKRLGDWVWYSGRQDIKDEGWKLHVSGRVGNAQLILDLVLPVLQRGEFVHKFLPNTTAVERQTGEQEGKFLVVYPDSIIHAFAAVSEIDVAIGARVRRDDSPIILNEKAVGTTIVYTRYGSFGNGILYDPRTKTYVNDSIGYLKPDWIEDPWIHYPNVTAVTYYDPWPTHSKEGRRMVGRR